MVFILYLRNNSKILTPNNKYFIPALTSIFKKEFLLLKSLQASQQFSGIIAVIVYSTEIFIGIGLEEKTWAIYAAIFLSFVETVAHVLVMWIIDLKGRRFLLLFGLIGMSVSCFMLGLLRIFSVNLFD